MLEIERAGVGWFGDAATIWVRKELSITVKSAKIRKGETESVPVGHQHTCSTCGKVNISVADLASHLRLQKRGQMRTTVNATQPKRPTCYLCEFCDKDCKSVAERKHHRIVQRDRQISNIGKTDTHYVCHVCRGVVKASLVLRTTQFWMNNAKRKYRAREKIVFFCKGRSILIWRQSVSDKETVFLMWKWDIVDQILIQWDFPIVAGSYYFTCLRK